MGELAIRIKGSAIPVGPDKWGWKINVFVDGEAANPITMRNGENDIFDTREKAVEHMQSHVPGIQDCLNKGLNSFSELKINEPKKKKPEPIKYRKLMYEQFIHKIYNANFWDDVAKHVRYDFNYRKLKQHLLNDRPEPNILLITGLSNDLKFEPSEAPHLLDLPFSTCIIEATDKTLFNLTSKDLPAGCSDIQTLLVTEIDDSYGFLGITDEGDCTWAVDTESEIYKIFMTVTKSFCSFINSKNAKVGQSKINVRFKHKKTGLVKIKKLIHISKIVSMKPMNPGSFDVDWSHRWEVRGHWRSVGEGKMGKDRKGDYKIKGFTWVKAYVKGPDDKDLIKKVRVIDDQ